MPPDPTPAPTSPPVTPGPPPTSPPLSQLGAAGSAADSGAGQGNVGGTTASCPQTDLAEIAVRVRTSDGTPVQGAAVSVSGQGLSGFTGSDGVHDFGTVPPDTYTVVGQKDGYSPSSGGGVSAPTSQTLAAPAGTSTQFELMLDSVMTRLAVHVQRADGTTPIEGVTVSVSGKEWHGVTDANGNFDFQEVPPDTYTVVGEKDGYDPVPIVALTASQTQDVPAGTSVQFILTLEPRPQCFAQLKTRPVDVTVAKLVGATHSFWYVKAKDGTEYIVSGGPSGPPDKQMLNEWKDSDLERAGRPDRVSNPTWWDSGTSPEICAGVDKLLAAVDAWPQDTIPYHPFSGPNSNSAAHNVGDAGGFSPSRPDGAIAWDEPVPKP
jgi:hypothetical protein